VSTVRKTKQPTGNSLTTNAICELVKRRLRDAGLPSRLSPHSFRVTMITDLLTQGVPLEDVQYLAEHSSTRTTRLYDRRQKKVRGVSSRGFLYNGSSNFITTEHRTRKKPR